jgi:hypothetical protein
MQESLAFSLLVERAVCRAGSALANKQSPTKCGKNIGVALLGD